MPEQPVLSLNQPGRGGRPLSRLKTPARLRQAIEEGQWLATVRNISAEGIGLIANLPVRKGMHLTVELPIDPDKPPQPRLVRVTNARVQAGNQWWNVGGVFLKKLTKQELDALRARSPSVIPKRDRRTLVRYPTRLKAPCRLIRATEEGPWLATVRNVSERGVGLLADRMFKPGTYLTIELPTKAQKLIKPKLVQVLHATAVPGNQAWTVGAKFLTKPTPEELAVLL